MYATVTLESFFRVSPQITFEFISKHFPVFQRSTTWQEKHASLLLLYCLCGQYSLSSNVHHKTVSNFISTTLDFLLETNTDEIQRIRETSLFVTAQIFYRYPEFLNASQDPVSLISTIIDKFDVSNKVHPTILIRYSSIVYYIISAFPPRYQSPITSIFDDIYNLLNTIIEIGANGYSEAKLDVIQHGYEPLTLLYMHSTSQLYPKLIEIFQSTLESIQVVFESSHGQDNIRDLKLAMMCSCLTQLILRLHDHIKDHFENTLELLFNILNHQSVLVYEEALLTLAVLIIQIQDPSDEILSKLFEYIKGSLDSFSPQVINSTSLLITKLYETHYNKLEDKSDLLIPYLLSLIEHTEIVRSAKPSLIKMLGFIYLKMKEKRNLLDQYNEQFYEVLMKFRDYPIDLNNINDIEFASQLYEALAIGFSAFGTIYFNCQIFSPPEEKEKLLDISTLCDKIYKVATNHIDDNTLKAALEMLWAYSEHTSRKNNVVLNRGTNHKVIDLAINRKNMKLKEQAKKTKEKLHNT